MKSFFEGKTHAEIAEEMNLSVKSINRYKQKTMELLRVERLSPVVFIIPVSRATVSSLLKHGTLYD